MERLATNLLGHGGEAKLFDSELSEGWVKVFQIVLGE